MGPDFSKNSLIPVIVQCFESRKVLMLAYMNELAWNKTLETGKAHYWSRSRAKLWMKGEESGNVQLVKEICIDCDSDAILLKIDQIGGAACHTGYESCFYRCLKEGRFEAQGVPVFDPQEVYKK